MIINIRGTSGSGKSTIVRKVMDHYLSRTPIFVPGRARPVGYRLARILPCGQVRELYVVGHYEVPCGGCDTLSTDHLKTVYGLVREWAPLGSVLFEGAILSTDSRHLLELSKERKDILVLRLTTSLEACAAGVMERRAAKGRPRPEGPNFRKNLAAKDRSAASTCRQFREAGIPVMEGDRAQVLAIVEEVLEL